MCLCLAVIGTACGTHEVGPLAALQANTNDDESTNSAPVGKKTRAEDGGERKPAGRAGGRTQRRPMWKAGARAERRAERLAEARSEVRAQRRDARAARVERRSDPQRGSRVRVSRVIDGDTIEVQLHGTTGVRLIGIDTPETVHPTEPIGCFGPEASDFTKETLEGEIVRLEYDVERADHYGRTLAYIFVDGLLFNQTLVARGYAQVTTYPPNDRYIERFLAARRAARRSDKGLWGQCSSRPAGDGGAVSSTSQGRGEPTGNARCDPSYSPACIPPFPPDIDCPDAGAEAFRSTGSDPHGFDADGDGIACD